MQVVCRVYKLENQVQQILPDFVCIIVLVHASLNFDEEITDLVNEILGINYSDGIKKICFKEFFGSW